MPAPSTTPTRGRRTEWLAAGVFDRLLAESIAAYDRIIGLVLSDIAVDGSIHKAPSGGEGTGPEVIENVHTDGYVWVAITAVVGVDQFTVFGELCRRPETHAAQPWLA